jgi:ketosteroid isomerase-like protein
MRALIAALLLFAAPAAAQESLDPKQSSGQVLRYLKMITTCETDGLDDVIDPEVSSFGLRGAFAQSRRLYVQAVRAQCDAGLKPDLTYSILRRSEYGDIAIAAIEAKGTSVGGGRSTPVDVRLTLVLGLGSDGVWRIVHSQTATAF